MGRKDLMCGIDRRTSSIPALYVSVAFETVASDIERRLFCRVILVLINNY